MTKFLQILACTVGFIAALVLLWACQGFQAGQFGLEKAVALLTLGAVLGLLAVFFALFFILWQRPMGVPLLAMFVSAVVGLVSFYLPYQDRQLSRALPPLHDVSTDTSKPPAFMALRAGTGEAAQFDLSRSAAAQRLAYPDLRPIVYVEAPEKVAAEVEQLIAEHGWEQVPVVADANGVHIEAVATTRWLKAKEDVVVRLTHGTAGSTIFDMRSRSRDFTRDGGSNARRIREFTAALNERMM